MILNSVQIVLLCFLLLHFMVVKLNLMLVPHLLLELCLFQMDLVSHPHSTPGARLLFLAASFDPPQPATPACFFFSASPTCLVTNLVLVGRVHLNTLMSAGLPPYTSNSPEFFSMLPSPPVFFSRPIQMYSSPPSLHRGSFLTVCLTAPFLRTQPLRNFPSSPPRTTPRSVLTARFFPTPFYSHAWGWLTLG